MSATTLDELIVAVRAEIGDSTNVAMGVDSLPTFRQILKRIQETYYQDFDWPNLIFNPEEAILANERFYTFNEGINPERIFKVWAKVCGRWEEIHYGIDPEHYNESDSENGETQSYPRRWSFYGDNQFEIWPMPSEPTTIKFRAVRTLPRLTVGTDTCLLDPTLLILSAAAEMLAHSKPKEAQLKLSMASSHYVRLKGRWQKNRMFSVVPPSASSARCTPRAPR